VRTGRWRPALDRLHATNDFPEFTGFTCPAPCEPACVLEINDDPVMIKQVELAIIERAFEEGWVKPRPPRQRTGRRVAVVGSGPAGLAAANQLNRAGHSVVVYERDEAVGGLLRFGIPDFKLEKRVIDRRLDILAAEGISFHCGVDVGVDLPVEELRAGHDAVVLAVGSRVARALEVPGAGLAGVHDAMDYLYSATGRWRARSFRLRGTPSPRPGNGWS
jgi:glutamate synthase (NADPH/NADH) small chain